MDIEISQWGNSLGIRIPKAFAQAMGLKKNSRARLTLENGHMVLEPEPLQESDFLSSPVDLKSLTDRISEKNRHKLLLDDAPVGKEVW